MNFCDQKSLNMQTLRMTCEAKNQLRDILTNIGFPEESLLPQSFNFTGPDNQLDVVVVFVLVVVVVDFPYCPDPSASLA